MNTTYYNPDLPVNYVSFLKQNTDRLGDLSHSKQKSARVAIIGAGMSGLYIGREMLKLGITPVIYEGTTRIGGRLYSENLSKGVTGSIAELGAMRFPASGKVFWTIVDQITNPLSRASFTNPGVVDTVLHDGDCAYLWKKGEAIPDRFQFIQAGFEKIEKDLTTAWDEAVSKVEKSSNEGKEWIESIEPIVALWQSYIDQYQDMTFKEMVTHHNPEWGERELDLFGTLGIGTGGFKAIEDISALELIRILITRMETDQLSMLEGAESVTQGLFRDQVESPSGKKVSLQDLGVVKTGMYVTDIRSRVKSKKLMLSFENHTYEGPFDLVVVTTTLPAMREMGLEKSTSPLSVAQRKALSSHTIPSSKTFLKTRNKFWQDQKNNGTTNIQMRELPRQLYAIDNPKTKEGVVLLSYTWGQDSKASVEISTDKQSRAKHFKESVAVVDSEYSSQLPTSIRSNIKQIDWQQEKGYNGAFRLNLPGEESAMQLLREQYLEVGKPNASGLILAGDVNPLPGWGEGSAISAINAVTAMIQFLGGSLRQGSPMELPSKLHSYR